MRLFKLLIFSQSTYILLTAIWPLIHIESFILITGPKHDIWLVKTVGALLVPIGLCMLSIVLFRSDEKPAIVLGSSTSVSFMIIDFYYSSRDVISDIYMIDGFIEFVFLLGWSIVLQRRFKKNASIRPSH